MQADVNSISINGQEYIPKGQGVVMPQSPGEIKIVVLQRGWVMVGYYEAPQRNPSRILLHHACVIRSWGTTKGLGEIAKNGPTKDTKLDPTNGLVEFHELTVVATISCEKVKWQSHLA